MEDGVAKTRVRVTPRVGVRVRMRFRVGVGVRVRVRVRLGWGIATERKNKENMTNRVAKFQLREVRIVGIPI